MNWIPSTKVTEFALPQSSKVENVFKNRFKREYFYLIFLKYPRNLCGNKLKCILAVFSLLNEILMNLEEGDLFNTRVCRNFYNSCAKSLPDIFLQLNLRLFACRTYFSVIIYLLISKHFGLFIQFPVY